MYLNESPLILWLSEDKGIAFGLIHRSRSDSTYSVYSIFIFKPGYPICAQDSEVSDSESWRKLASYSLAQPRRTAQANRNDRSLYVAPGTLCASAFRRGLGDSFPAPPHCAAASPLSDFGGNGSEVRRAVDHCGKGNQITSEPQHLTRSEITARTNSRKEEITT
jgi:hypothetical protein